MLVRVAAVFRCGDEVVLLGVSQVTVVDEVSYGLDEFGAAREQPKDEQGADHELQDTRRLPSHNGTEVEPALKE